MAELGWPHGDGGTDASFDGRDPRPALIVSEADVRYAELVASLTVLQTQQATHGQEIKELRAYAARNRTGLHLLFMLLALACVLFTFTEVMYG